MLIKIKNNKINQTKMLRSIDTYSLGILIPMLFLRPEVIGAIQQGSQLMDDFYALFGVMTSPLSNVITAENAYKQFKQLLNKYKNGVKKERKRTKKRTIRKPLMIKKHKQMNNKVNQVSQTK